MLKQIHQALASLPLARKLALMAVLLVAPTLVVGALFYSSQDVQLQATRQQLEGLRYTRPFVALLTQMGLHRDAAAMALSGTGAGEGSVREAQAEVDRAVKALKQSESAAAAAARFQTQALTSEILEGWDTNLKPNWNSGNAISSLDMHALVMAQVGDVIRLVGRNAHGSEPGAAATPFDYSLLFALPASLESLGKRDGLDRLDVHHSIDNGCIVRWQNLSSSGPVYFDRIIARRIVRGCKVNRAISFVVHHGVRNRRRGRGLGNH